MIGNIYFFLTIKQWRIIYEIDQRLFVIPRDMVNFVCFAMSYYHYCKTKSVCY